MSYFAELVKENFERAKNEIKSQYDQLHLPTQFLYACTLREGTVISVIVLMIVAGLTNMFITMLLVFFPDGTDAWWHQKFKDDFDPYINGENEDIIMTYYPLWRPLSYAIMAVETAYSATGVIVLWAAWKKDVHPAFYLPWLVFTGLLVTTIFGIVLALVIVTWIISKYRDITVTWDMVPTILVAIYAVAWAYGFLVGIAHYKRRVIVHWWKKYYEEQERNGKR